MKKSIYTSFITHWLSTARRAREIKAQIKILEILPDHLCKCELTEKGREAVSKMIKDLKHELSNS